MNDAAPAIAMLLAERVVGWSPPAIIGAIRRCWPRATRDEWLRGCRIAAEIVAADLAALDLEIEMLRERRVGAAA